jgi:hypothetical protein
MDLNDLVLIPPRLAVRGHDETIGGWSSRTRRSLFLAVFAVIAAVPRCYFYDLSCRKTRISAASLDLPRCFFWEEQQ